MKTCSTKASKTTQFRQLPQSVETEESILATCLLGGADEALDLLDPEDFYSVRNQHIFSAIKNLSRKEVIIEVPSVVVELKDAGVIEEIGGASHVARIIDSIPVVGGLEHCCKVIKKAAIGRKLLAVCNDLALRVYDGEDIEDLVDHAQKELNNLGMNSAKGQTVSYADLANVMPEKWEALASKAGMTGVPSGISTIDAFMGGFQPSDLIILAARPGMGKTALALNFAQGTAESGYPILFLSLEMSAGQLYARQTSREARVDGQKFRVGNIEPNE